MPPPHASLHRFSLFVGTCPCSCVIVHIFAYIVSSVYHIIPDAALSRLANFPRASDQEMYTQQRHRPQVAACPTGAGGARWKPVSASHRAQQRPSNNKAFFWTIIFFALASTSQAFCVPRVPAAPPGRLASPLARSLVDKVRNCRGRVSGL